MRPERAKFNSARSSTFAEFAVLFPVSRENARETGPARTASVITQACVNTAFGLAQKNVPKIGTRANDREDSMNKLTVTAIALAAGFWGGSRVVAGTATGSKVSANALFPDAARE
jgi:hypothetical protein